jgi:DNA invertase Pin-like site-specific DNA recombinase
MLIETKVNHMAKIGYARVSTRDQVLDLQLDALRAAGCETVFQDHGESGAKRSRPQFDKCLDSLKSGDTLCVYSLSRAGRNVQHLLELSEVLKGRGVEFVSLTEGIDTSSACGRMVFTMLAALATFERELMVERIKAGIKATRDRGASWGRKPPSDDVIASVRRWASQGYTAEWIGEQVGMSRATVYRMLKMQS